MRVRLTVRVHPGARSEGLAGRLGDGTLKLAVAAPPEGGRANRAVEALLAGILGVPRARVTVVRGTGARSKVVEVEGLDESEVGRRIQDALGGGAR